MLSENFKHLSRLDIPGGGQITLVGTTAYVGHMDPPHGTSIYDVADPRKPKLLSTIPLEGDATHSHKVRVVGDLMFTNCERPRRSFWRRARTTAEARAELMAKNGGKEPDKAELAKATGFDPEIIKDLLDASKVEYPDAGFKIWDISDKTKPKLIHHQYTGREGVHRFDVDERYAYMSTGMEGFEGNILVIYDHSNPTKLQEVGRWWIPGQHTAGGEVRSWHGSDKQLHHAMRLGNELWAGCWHGGVAGIDVTDISKPKTITDYDYHPAFAHPTHTAMRVPYKVGGKDIIAVIDEEERHTQGRIHAFVWFFELTADKKLVPISTFSMSERDTPLFDGGGRFGAHQYQEKFPKPILFATWFSGGLRAVDFSNPLKPKETGFFIPDKAKSNVNVQSNDATVDDRGLVYVLDRNIGLDILEFQAW